MYPIVEYSRQDGEKATCMGRVGKRFFQDIKPAVGKSVRVAFDPLSEQEGIVVSWVNLFGLPLALLALGIGALVVYMAG